MRAERETTSMHNKVKNSTLRARRRVQEVVVLLAVVREFVSPLFYDIRLSLLLLLALLFNRHSLFLSTVHSRTAGLTSSSLDQFAFNVERRKTRFSVLRSKAAETFSYRVKKRKINKKKKFFCIVK